MPQFAPGEAKTAVASISVRPAGLSCEVELYLGPDEATKVATSGGIPFTSTGASQNVSLPIAMPATEGAYHVYVDVYAGGYLIAAYQAIEDVVIAPVGVEVSGISVNPTSLTTARHEYETSLGLGYWGDPFTISITFKNPFDMNIWVRPDFAFGKLTGEPLEYVEGTLKGFVAEKLLYFRLLFNTEYMQGDYSYTVDWQQLYHPQNAGSNMPQFVRDPDGIAVLAAGGDCWLKVPALGTGTTVKQAHLGSDLRVKAWKCALCGMLIGSFSGVQAHYDTYHPGIEIVVWSWGGLSGAYIKDSGANAVNEVYVSAEWATGIFDLQGQ